jgi:protein-S-isoprenylcysteine O-methyltransferase Ste14
MSPWPVSVPLLVIGGTVALYWYRVLRMARKQRRRTGRAANLVPPEPVGRALRILWAPVVVLWVVHPLAAAAAWDRPPAGLRPLVDVGWLRWGCAAVVVIGFLVTRRCWKRMGQSWRMGIDPGEQTRLVFDGLFGYVRHPIYALSAGMMLATMVALPTPAMLAAGAAHVLLLLWESAREERHLVAVHGPAYEAYRRRVGRILPRSVRPYAPIPSR